MTDSNVVLRLTPDQIERLRSVTPETGELILLSMNLMAQQFQDVLLELRAENDRLNVEYRLLRDDVEYLRKELAGFRTSAIMIEALMASVKATKT